MGKDPALRTHKKEMERNKPQGYRKVTHHPFRRARQERALERRRKELAFLIAGVFDPTRWVPTNLDERIEHGQADIANLERKLGL